MAKERFEFIKRYAGTIGRFDPRLTMVANHVRFTLGIKSNGFTGV